MKKSGIFNLDRKDWQVAITLLLALALIIFTHLFAIKTLDEYEGSSLIIEESYDANELLRNLDHHLVEVESSLRSLVILEDEKYAASAEEGLKMAKQDIVAIRRFFHESSQENYLEHLEELVDEKIRFNKNALDSFHQGGSVAAAQMLSSGRGILLRDSITALTDSLRQRHREHLENYFLQKSKTSGRLRTISWLSVLAVLAITAFSIFYLVKTARRRYRAEKDKGQKQHELEQHLTFIKDLFDNAPIGFHSTDAEGNILEMNQTELDWLGYNREEVVGKFKITNLLPQDRFKEANEFRTELINTGRMDSKQWALQRKDGSIMNIIASSRAVFDENGKFLYARSALMDFSERKEIEDKLEQALQSAERSSLLKEQFVANMSHEIRTPLNAILGFSNLLQRTELSPNQKEFSDNIRTSSENLLAIINDVLDFSKIEAGALHLERIPFSLPGLLHSIDNMFRYRAEETRLKFEVRADDTLPEAVLGDPTRLTQILVNLLGNAFKFTSVGGVKLEVGQVSREDKNVLIRFSVQDTGIGIPSDKLEAIFDRFGQATSDTTRRFGGAGLGLTISKQLVELQGGRITVESEEGKGANFIFEIPYSIAEATVGNGNGGQQQAGSFKNQKVNILIVEDNPMNRRIAELMLESWGFRYDYAENGRAALDLLRRKAYDLVLMDIQMPEMDGYTAARTIRQKLRLDVPIIATTAHAFAGEREKCISYGMNDYISKPIKEAELYALIVRYAPQGRPEKGASTPSIPTGKSPEGFDRQYVLDISKGEPAVLQEMAGLFVSQSAKELERMEKALRSNNFGEAATAAHSMKSTAAYMGFASTLGEVLKKLELEARSPSPDTAALKAFLEQVKKMRDETVVFLEKEFPG
ncbi:MAG: response regulator [Lewinellaceae bacterium]|nr:response regulator [Lewinellaceae bacterium]